MFGRFVVGVVVGASALFGSAAIAGAQVQDPVLIGPKQSFVGLVNNRSSNAVIEMACFGPTRRGEYGHPLAGQTLEVKLVGPLTSAAPLAFTGTAHEIQATYAISSTLEILLAEFSSYYVPEPLSTSLSLPCSGTAVIPFAPVEGGPHARPWRTRVTFVPQP
ncbi:MAG TPA: hypothetical protein VMI13_02440 [Solirubrobacteraceae bacterium]|nr:hypothetical protein [Solirubrobacteraceae bacterium]